MSRGCNVIDRERGPGTRVVTPLQLTSVQDSLTGGGSRVTARDWLRVRGVSQSVRGTLLPTVTGPEEDA